MRFVTLLCAAALAVACENPVDDAPNVFPPGRSVREVVPSGGGPAPDAGFGAGGGDAAGQGGWGGTFLVECLEIRRVGTAGPDDFQTRLYGTQWADDIAQGKLNILPWLAAADPAGGTATLRMASGVGPDPAALCIEPHSLGSGHAGTWTPGPADGPADGCLAPAGSGDGEAVLAFQLPAGEPIYIYEQEHDGTPLNTTLDPQRPDALPLHGVAAVLVMAADGASVTGTLHGCLRESWAAGICSCLGQCPNVDPADRWTEGPCAGAPRGSVPLLEMLVGIEPSEPCSTEVAAPAYDVDVRFFARRLAAVPPVCR